MNRLPEERNRILVKERSRQEYTFSRPGREELGQCTSRSEAFDLMMLMKAQLLAAEKREECLEKMLKTAVSATATQPPTAVTKAKQILAEHPVQSSTASLAEFLHGKIHGMTT